MSSLRTCSCAARTIDVSAPIEAGRTAREKRAPPCGSAEWRRSAPRYPDRLLSTNDWVRVRPRSPRPEPAGVAGADHAASGPPTDYGVGTVQPTVTTDTRLIGCETRGQRSWDSPSTFRILRQRAGNPGRVTSRLHLRLRRSALRHSRPRGPNARADSGFSPALLTSRRESLVSPESLESAVGRELVVEQSDIRPPLECTVLAELAELAAAAVAGDSPLRPRAPPSPSVPQ